MTGLTDRVAADIQRHAILMPGERVLVAVSGGPDSLALLALLRDLMPRIAIHLSVAHFDHGWREDSPEDARFVNETARRWGLTSILGRPPADQPIRRSEDSARRARYAFLRKVARETESSVIALGHTQDDQIETLLLHLLRGSGSRGLSAMRPRSADLARPLLHVARSVIEAYLADRDLLPRRDPTNADSRYARNRLRQVVLPALDAFDPAARRLLARTADILAEEDDLLEDEAGRLDRGILNDPSAFKALPIALQRRLLRQLRPGFGYAEVEARRDHLAPPLPADPVGGDPRLVTRECSCDPSTFRARDAAAHVDADTLTLPLRIAPRQPGDRVQPLGFPHLKRVQDVLVDARIPRHLRDTLPIVRDQHGIVWIHGVTVAEPHRVTERTRRQLHLEIVP